MRQGYGPDGIFSNGSYNIHQACIRDKIESYLKSDGFSTQTSPSSSHGNVIQAKKGGFLAGIVDADRALSIVISGDPNDFTVRIGIGKWLKNLGVAALETLLLSDLFLVIDVSRSNESTRRSARARASAPGNIHRAPRNIHQ